jgi:hypothetical protein
MIEKKPYKNKKVNFVVIKAIQMLFLALALPIAMIMVYCFQSLMIDYDIKQKTEVVAQELGVSATAIDVFLTSEDDGTTHLVVTPDGNYHAIFTEDNKVKLKSLKK